MESDIIETVFTVAFLTFFIIKLDEVKVTEVGILYTQKINQFTSMEAGRVLLDVLFGIILLVFHPHPHSLAVAL